MKKVFCHSIRRKTLLEEKISGKNPNIKGLIFLGQQRVIVFVAKSLLTVFNFITNLTMVRFVLKFQINLRLD